VGQELFAFAFICFPYADNAVSITARGPYDEDNAPIEPSRRNEPLFTIVGTIIPSCQVMTCKNLDGASKIQSVFDERFIAFGDITLDLHSINRINKNC
jgi:hypothetical protein